MRRTLAVALLTLLCPPAAAASGPRAAGDLGARLAACGTGAAADERFAVFVGSMAAMPGTRRMAARFDLQARREGQRRWRTVPMTGRWYRSDREGRARFVQTQRVERLSQGAAFRARVRFRWYGAEGVQRDRVRHTPACRQPDQRPDLEVASLAVLPGSDAATSRYVLGVRNAGRTAAGPFEAGMASVAGAAGREIEGLPAGERTTIEFVAPRCRPGETVAFRLDVRGVVREADEGDNALTWACGAPIDSVA